LNDYNYEAPEINLQGVTDRTLDHFVDEEKVFNEWLKSCMQTNTIVLNSSFLELLNYFTDRGQCDIELFNGKPTDDMFTGQTRVGKIFEGPSVSGERTVHANNQPMRNTDHFSRLCDDVRPGSYTGCSQVASTSAAREINGYTKNTDPENMFDGHTDHSTFMRPIGIRTSAICDRSHETKPDQNSRTGKLNFNDLFKSQLAGGYIDDLIVGNTSLPVGSLSVDVDDDNSPANIATGAVVRDDDQDEDDEVMGNVDFEELFQSQRADRFIEKYSEEIAAERHNNDYLSVVSSGGSKKAETCHEEKIDLLFDNQRSNDDEPDEADKIMGNIDLKKLYKSQRSDKIANDGRRSPVVFIGGKKAVTSGHQPVGKMDFSVLYKNQRSDGYIEDFMVRNTGSRVRPSSADDHVVRGVNADDADDHSMTDIVTNSIVLDDDQDEDDEIMGKIDVEKLYKSQISNNCKEKETTAGRQNVDQSIANGCRMSPIVCVDGKKVVTSGHQSVGKMDFSVLYKNQRSDGYIEDFMVRNTGPRVRPSNAVDRVLFHIDDDQDKDDELMGNIDSEKLFKSQRAAKCMKIDEIDKISAKRPNVNRSIINSGRRSPIVCGGALDKVDYNALYKSQRSDEYIKDYTDKSVAKIAAKKFEVADDWPLSDVRVEDDDVISLNSSQEFFSCRPSKKVTQTKLTGHFCTDRAIEIIDLSSPPPSSSSTAATSAASLPIAVDRFPTDSVSTSHVGGVGLLQQTTDDDDMDFMFIDYNSDGNAAADIFTQKHKDGGDEDVFTQKHRDGGDADFFTQKKCDSSGTKAAVSPPLSPVISAAKPPLKIDVTKRAGHSTQSYDNGMMPFNIMKAARLVDLLKPGLSMKRNTTAAASKRQVDKVSTAFAFKRKVDNGSPVAALKRQVNKASTTVPFNRQVDSGSPVAALKRRVTNASPVAGIKQQFDNGSMAALALKRKVANDQTPADDMSPIHAPNGQRRRPQFSQSTPKVTEQPKQRRRETVTTAATTVTTAGKVNSLLTSSSDSDNFVGYGRIENTTSPRRRVKKKRRRKPKKVSILMSNAIIIRLTSSFLVSTI